MVRFMYVELKSENSKKFKKDLSSFRHFFEGKWREKIGSLPPVFCLFWRKYNWASLNSDRDSNVMVFLGWQEKDLVDDTDTKLLMACDLLHKNFEVVSLIISKVTIMCGDTVLIHRNRKLFTHNEEENFETLLSVYQDFYNSYDKVDPEHVFNIIRKYEGRMLNGNDSSHQCNNEFLSYFFGDFFVLLYLKREKNS